MRIFKFDDVVVLTKKFCGFVKQKCICGILIFEITSPFSKKKVHSMKNVINTNQTRYFLSDLKLIKNYSF